MKAGRWWMLGVTCLSVIVVNLDLTILNVALPDISGPSTRAPATCSGWWRPIRSSSPG